MTPMLKSQKACFLSEGHSMLTASCKTIFGFADFLRKKKKVFCLDFYKPVPAELQISVTHSIKKLKTFFLLLFWSYYVSKWNVFCTMKPHAHWLPEHIFYAMKMGGGKKSRWHYNSYVFYTVCGCTV